MGEGKAKSPPPLLAVPLLEPQRFGDIRVFRKPKLLGQRRAHVGKFRVFRHNQHLKDRNTPFKASTGHRKATRSKGEKLRALT